MERNKGWTRAGIPAGLGGVAMLAGLLLSACTTVPVTATNPAAQTRETRRDERENALVPTLAYYQMLHRMSAAEIGRERQVLAALPVSPNSQVRMAMVYGHPRGPQDFPKALGLLEGVLKSTDPTAIELQPLARLLIDNYIERQKLEGQLEKQSQQLKESQRKTVELQEKIDNLADIERTLPQRPRAAKPVVKGGAQ